jgi:hypothetical protein
MFHVRLSRFPLVTKDIVNVDEQTLLSRFVDPWLADRPIVHDGRRWSPAATRLTIYEGPRLTSVQQGVAAWLKVVELGEDVTDTFLTRGAGAGLRALADPRLAGAAAEYASAREELRTDTPITRKQAVTEACAAVESVMKVLLDERDVERDGTEAAKRLFDLLTANGIADTTMADIVLAPSRFGNRRARHGAGATAHDVTAAEAEAVVAAAANAMVFLAGLLPDPR